jgi:hypothetical protein
MMATYANQQAVKDACVEFINRKKFHFCITLDFNNPASYWLARECFKNWLARIDSHAFGRRWSTIKSSRRTFAVAGLEHPWSNSHLHVSLRLPKPLRSLTEDELEYIVASAWTKVIPSGKIHMKISDPDKREKYMGYTSKTWWSEVGYEAMMISTEFHRDECD